MMLTEKECKEALSEIEDNLCELEQIKTGVVVNCLFDKNLETINQLIEEHFSNPPLTFGELKVGMWVWDNKLKEWRKVIEKLIVGVSEGSEFYEDIYVKGTKVIRIGLHKFDWKDILFESKRFYRKEVQE